MSSETTISFDKVSGNPDVRLVICTTCRGHGEVILDLEGDAALNRLSGEGKCSDCRGKGLRVGLRDGSRIVIAPDILSPAALDGDIPHRKQVAPGVEPEWYDRYMASFLDGPNGEWDAWFMREFVNAYGRFESEMQELIERFGAWCQNQPGADGGEPDNHESDWQQTLYDSLRDSQIGAYEPMRRAQAVIIKRSTSRQMLPLLNVQLHRVQHQIAQVESGMVELEFDGEGDYLIVDAADSLARLRAEESEVKQAIARFS